MAKTRIKVGDRVRFIHGGYTPKSRVALPGSAERCMGQEGIVTKIEGTLYIWVAFDRPMLPSGPHFTWRFKRILKKVLGNKPKTSRLPKDDFYDLIV